MVCRKLKVRKNFSGGSVVKIPLPVEEMWVDLWFGKIPGEGNDNSLQYSCLGNPMDRDAWQASPWGHKRVKYDLVTKQQQSKIKI